MNLPRHLRRLRLELDQTLRTRAFVSRAVRDLLRPEEALDLIAQLAFLLWSIGREQSAHLIELAGRDARRLGDGAPLGNAPPPCTAVSFLSAVTATPQGAALGSPCAFDLTVSVTATSWVDRAACSADSEFLAELGSVAARSLARFDRGDYDATASSESLCAFAELARGMLLGVASYLDDTWPAPIHTPNLAAAHAGAIEARP